MSDPGARDQQHQTAQSARGSGAPLIALENVSLSLAGRMIVTDVNLTIEEREFCCIIGSSGCGKTSLLRLIAGLFRPTSGQIYVGGARAELGSGKVSIVFQDYSNALLPWRTAAGNVSLALEATNLSRTARSDRINELLEQVGLLSHASKFPGQLSGGMQQRLQIARCLAQSPKVLLMDEPFGALDAMTRQSLQDEILRLAADNRITVVFVTHDLEEAIYLGDKVVAMSANPGRVQSSFNVSLARPRDQLTTPEHADYVALRRELFEFMTEYR